MANCASNLSRLGRRNGANMTLVALALTCISSGIAQAATIPFTFELTFDTFVEGAPSVNTPALPTSVLGSGSFVPFGNAIYSETGTITFMMLPSGDFVPSSVLNNFTASFNRGTDTFTGTNSVMFGATTFSSTLTILGGTGIFSGASGLATGTSMMVASSGNPAPDFNATAAISGAGEITAPGLNAVPEPATYGLVGLALGAAVFANRKKAGA
jgi:PEP-CTERM motif